MVASFDFPTFDGEGTYRLTMVHSPGPITVSAGDQLTVTWDAVDEAAEYMVQLDAGDDEDLMERVTDASFTCPISDLTDDPNAPITVKVRAMRSHQGKGASKWSDEVTCQ